VLAQFEQADSAVSTLDEDWSTAANASPDQAVFAAGTRRSISLGKTLATLERDTSGSARADNDNDTILAEMRAAFGHMSLANRSTFDDDDIDPSQLLADLRGSFPVSVSKAAEGDDEDDPEAMLAALEVDASSYHRDNSRIPQSRVVYSEDVQEELDTLHEKLTNTTRFTRNLSSTANLSKSAQSLNDGLEDGIDKAVIALQLEEAGLPWEHLRGWTTYLFSSGLDGYRACQEKDKIVKQAAEELGAIIKQTLESEKRYQDAEDLARLPRRLIVSNIAAGADEDDLKEFFHPLRYQV
jgi:hypothetical protein